MYSKVKSYKRRCVTGCSDFYMTLKYKEINKSIEGVVIQVKGYSFDLLEKHFHPVPGAIHLPDDAEHRLINCLAGKWDGGWVVRSGCILNRTHGAQFRNLARTLAHKVERIVSVQVNPAGSEWGYIEAQHEVLRHYPVAHLSIPLESLYVSTKQVFKLPQTIKAIENLSIFQNASGWIRYAKWFLEDLQKEEHLLKLKALEEFVLEARFDDFRNEVKSPITERVLLEINDAYDRISQIDPKEVNKLVSEEKNLLLLRHELMDIVGRMDSLLTAIAIDEEEIDKIHPEFSELRCRTLIFHSLLNSQIKQEENHAVSSGQQLMLLAILNEMLGVYAHVNCATGVERTSLAFSIMMATKMLLQRFPRPQVSAFVRGWGQNGNNSDLKETFKQLVWKLFSEISIPLIHIQPKSNEFQNGPDTKLNRVWLEFFPSDVSIF